VSLEVPKAVAFTQPGLTLAFFPFESIQSIRICVTSFRPISVFTKTPISDNYLHAREDLVGFGEGNEIA